jgi:cell division protein FtsQ
VKRKSILTRQVVTRKRAMGPSKARTALHRLGSLFLKVSFLLAVLGVMSLAFLYLYGYLLTSPFIRLEQVEVLGVGDELKSELLQMARLNYEQSLLAINLDELKRRLEKHPWVRSVELEKSFPHSLVIRVEKEEPWALALRGKLFYMDRWGKLFKEVEPDERIDFPVVTGLSAEEKERRQQLQEAVQVLRLFESQGPPWSLSNLSEVHMKEDGSVCLYLSFIPGVVKLTVTDLNTKFDELKKVVEHLTSTGRIHMVRTINLDYHDGAAVAFEKG